MTPLYYVFILILLQLVFLGLDFLHALTYKPRLEQKINKRSIVFVGVVVLAYGIIQFGGIALIPKTQLIIDWFRDLIPNFKPPLYALGTVPIITTLIAGIFLFYLAGFWDYIIHRFVSHHKNLFFTHEYHHLPNRLFLALPGLSTRPFVVVALLPTIVFTVASAVFLAKIFGLQNIEFMPIVYWITLLQTSILAITHSEFFMQYGFLNSMFKPVGVTSPQEHEMHHTIDLHGNYANFTIVWDRIFGTYVDPTKIENKNHQLGLPYDQDFLGAITMGQLKIPSKTREKYQIHRFCNIKEKQYKKEK